ncbi:MAG: radical SAM protein [Chitinivibrionales bacterium]|nr:radical SAM protein [Chitinivibrionales bacterium]
MKVTFVYPRFRKFFDDVPDCGSGLVEYFLADFTTPPSLGIPIMAAWTPPDVETELIDDNSGDPIDYAAGGDLIAINCFTPQATRAFEIADEYRRHGKLVIMGGFFPTAMPDECLQHADSVNVGEVEPTWERILDDARRGALKRKYIGGNRFDVAQLRVPKRDIFYSKQNYDWEEDLVQVSRGCLYNCAMCAIPSHMGGRVRLRPVEHVVDEIRSLKFENVYIADDVLFFPQRRIAEYAEELMRRLAPLEKKYFVSSTMALRTDAAFLDLIAQAGVRNFYCTMNVDPVSTRALQGGAKERQLLIDLVKQLEDRDIRFFGSFAVGREWDDTSIAERILELYTAANIRTSEFFIFTPYPGSVLWDRLERQNRIIDRTWSKYNGAHVVATHPNMTVEQLQEQFHAVWREFFKLQKNRNAAYLEPSTYQAGEKVVGKPLRRKGVPGQAVVTGIGVLSPIGNDTETLTSALREGRSGLAPISRFDTGHFRTGSGGEIRGFDPRDELSAEEVQTYHDRYLQYAIATARRAMRDAGLAQPAPNHVRRDIAMVLGTCNGGLLSAEDEYAWKHGLIDKPFDEATNLQAQLYGFGKALAAALGIGGETWLVTTACSSTSGAIGLAQTLVNSGQYKTVLVGGADALCVANMSGFDALKATSTGITAPFSLPEGLNVGEAACFWVVEDMEAALLRSSRCYARLVGHATTSDAYHPTAPDPRGEGAFRTLRAALDDCTLSIDAIGCINTHGTGTAANDRSESKGIRRMLGDVEVPAVSLKSFFGHCMGTAGILEATCGILAMNEGFIPPTLNYTEPRPGCELDCVPNQARRQPYDAFVSANYAFGGNNAAVAIARWDHEAAVPLTRDTERVVITGTGCVSSVGLGCDQTMRALHDGTVGLSSVETLGLSGLGSQLAGLVPPLRAADVDRRLDFSGMNKLSMMATAAARLALEHGGLRVSRRNAEAVGIAMGICNGPPETEHMDSVFSSGTYAADIGCFSNVVANATAGWVSNALCIKGVNTTVSPGVHAGLQSVAYAYLMLSRGRIPAMLACAADEVYAQSYFNYDLIGYLHQGEHERDYRVRLESGKRKVIGEGAACVMMETLSAAREREAPVLGEVLGYGMSMDAGPFLAQNLAIEGLVHAIELALRRAGVGPDGIDAIVWAPQGNLQDRKVIDAVCEAIGERTNLPFAATSLHTGFIEAASALQALGLTLVALQNGSGLWPQRTGLPEIDARALERAPRCLLACGSSDLGYNYAVVIRPGPVA